MWWRMQRLSRYVFKSVMTSYDMIHVCKSIGIREPWGAIVQRICPGQCVFSGGTRIPPGSPGRRGLTSRVQYARYVSNLRDLWCSRSRRITESSISPRKENDKRGWIQHDRNRTSDSKRNELDLVWFWCYYILIQRWISCDWCELLSVVRRRTHMHAFLFNEFTSFCRYREMENFDTVMREHITRSLFSDGWLWHHCFLPVCKRCRIYSWYRQRITIDGFYLEFSLHCSNVCNSKGLEITCSTLLSIIILVQEM